MTSDTVSSGSAFPERQSRGARPASTVAVIVPNYNHARHLAECIAAIDAQTRPADEIIVIDDASTDDSREVLARIAARQPQVRVLFNERNLGAIATMNRGLSECRSDLVAFAAADDLLRPRFLETATEALERHPDVALFSAEVAIEQKGSAGEVRHSVRPSIRPSQRAAQFTPRQMRAMLASIDFFLVTQSVVFRRDMLAAAGGFEPALGTMADGIIATELALQHGFYFTPGIVATWRIDRLGLSRAAARDEAVLLRNIALARQRVADRQIYPDDYEKLFEGRCRVASCRIVLNEPRPDWGFIARIGATSRVGRLALAVGRRLPLAIARPAVLAGLFAAWRPLSLRAWLWTSAHRAWEGRRQARH